jgi:nitrite reductase/ring-hydroxylating ferredoxin subunit
LSELHGRALCSAEGLKPGQRQLVDVDGLKIAIVNVDGELFAFRNECPHMGAPMVHGVVTGTMLPCQPHEYKYGRENEIVRCPLHGWEFDIKTGKSLFDPNGFRIKTYEVREEEGSIVLYTNRR